MLDMGAQGKARMDTSKGDIITFLSIYSFAESLTQRYVYFQMILKHASKYKFSENVPVSFSFENSNLNRHTVTGGKG